MPVQQPHREDQDRQRIVDAFAIVGEFLGGMLWDGSARGRLGGDQPDPSNVPMLLNAAEAAALLGVSKSTLSRLEHEGRITRVMVGSRPKYARSELNRFSVEGSDAPSTRKRRAPPLRTSVSTPVVRSKGLTRKPNEADRYAARTYGLNLRAMKISGNLLQEVLDIDAKQYREWAQEGGALPAKAQEKFDAWCANYVDSARQMYPNGSDFLIDPATPLV